MLNECKQEKRVAIYIRVSTEEQAEHGYSIEGQEETLRTYCKMYGGHIVDKYVDAGISGKEMTKRHELQRLLKDAKAELFDEVLVWKVNRMSRKMKDLLEIVEKLKYYKISFRSITENLDTSSTMGNFVLQIMGSVGELERNNTVENVKMGLKQRARMGYHNGGKCLGYRSIVTVEGDRRSRKTELAIVPEEAATVHQIFNLYVSGKGFRSIANQLNKEGKRTKKGNTFYSDSVKEIVMNPIYAGIVRYNRFENWSEARRAGKNKSPILVEGKHEAIIPRDIWEKSQVILKSKAKKERNVYHSPNLLTGLILCPECGAPMTISRSMYTKKDGTKVKCRYYTCGVFKSKGSSVCHANSISADYAEKVVVERLERLFKHRKILDDIAKRIQDSGNRASDAERQELKSIDGKIDSLVLRKKKLFDMFEYDEVDKDTLMERIGQLNEEEDQLRQRKETLTVNLEEEQLPQITPEIIADLFDQFQAVLEQAPNDQKKSFLKMVIQKITINAYRKIDQIELAFGEEMQLYLDAQEDEEKNPASALWFHNHRAFSSKKSYKSKHGTIRFCV